MFGCSDVVVQLLARPIMLFIIIFQFNTAPNYTWDIVLHPMSCTDSFSMFTCANILWQSFPLSSCFDGLACTFIFAFSSIRLSQAANVFTQPILILILIRIHILIYIAYRFPFALRMLLLMSILTLTSWHLHSCSFVLRLLVIRGTIVTIQDNNTIA